MDSLWENQKLAKLLLASVVGLFVCALEIFPDVNEAMELAPLPQELRTSIASLMAIDLVSTFVYERALSALCRFSCKRQ